MSWNSTSPDGAKSVKQNEAPMQQNTAYIETTMGNTENDLTNNDAIRDHYWGVDANFDGRHRYINSPAYTIAGIPEDPDLGAGMGGTSFFKTKTAAESPTQQDVQPFFRNADSNIMQLLGIRACALIDVDPGTAAITVKYSHNVLSVAETGTAGIYDVTFDVPLPSNDYFVLGDCIRNSSSEQDVGKFFMPGATSVNNVKSTTFFRFMTFSYSGSPSLIRPLSVWFVAFGG